MKLFIVAVLVACLIVASAYPYPYNSAYPYAQYDYGGGSYSSGGYGSYGSGNGYSGLGGLFKGAEVGMVGNPDGVAGAWLLCSSSNCGRNGK
ncbi:unnamed protein product [Bursaphelenchus okinawaensis]|uniref:Uncharacterized protein n=1 Tax=Bursaphelenchus okinawaensis TaxID=465554 RepID=A0A811KH22_9BILA|nr:unnamed protein product [Bursaphelenchus okinawaensis]CAG9103040.1 unnamed protein product [Bursaphelenchus okinawaensis]